MNFYSVMRSFNIIYQEKLHNLNFNQQKFFLEVYIATKTIKFL